jgi:hypothetical protein
VSWRTFTAFVDEMRDHLPTTIDMGVLRHGRSGAVASYLALALRFLRLIDDNEHPTDAFKLYLATGPEARPAVLRQILSDAYGEHVQLEALANMSPEKLDDAIRTFGNRGSTVDKGRKFFLEAVKAAEVPLSKYIESKTRAYGRRSSTSRSRRRTDPEIPPGQNVIGGGVGGIAVGTVIRPIDEQIKDREIALLKRVLERYRDRPNTLDDWLEGMIQARES